MPTISLFVLDLHQGFSGEELAELPPSLSSVAMAELDAMGALLKGQVRRAAAHQVDAWRQIARAATAEVKRRLRR